MPPVRQLIATPEELMLILVFERKEPEIKTWLGLTGARGKFGGRSCFRADE